MMNPLKSFIRFDVSSNASLNQFKKTLNKNICNLSYSLKELNSKIEEIENN